jgi:Na+/H+ antiporter NhaA
MTLGRPAALQQTGNRQPSDQTRRSQLLGQLSGPLRQFMATESGSALLMVSATVVALVWANSPWSGAYEAVWATESSVLLGDAGLEMDLGHWINDGLMAVFFFVIGLEVRRDLAVGELTDRRRVVLPVLAGIGGMVVPVLLYLLIAPSGEATRGWGIVIGTDTAFLLGALALVGPATATQLRVFLLAITVIDDIAAVTIIGVVYSESIDVSALIIALAGVAVLVVLGLGGCGAPGRTSLSRLSCGWRRSALDCTPRSPGWSRVCSSRPSRPGGRL